MGYYYSLHDAQSFFVAVHDVPAMEVALAQVEQYSEWEWIKDETGNIISASRSESKSYDRGALEAIAPFVRDGSFVEISGEDDDDLFRIVFKSGKCYRVSPQIIWPEPE